jgi:hypothetical protein
MVWVSGLGWQGYLVSGEESKYAKEGASEIQNLTVV